MKQWFFKITDYADALLDEIEDLDWPQKIKTAQTNWIGRSVGAEIQFKIENSDDAITVFSTRPDTIFGATFVVLAPEHPLALKLAVGDFKEMAETYVSEAVKKSEIDRTNDTKEKTGVFTGSYAINPISGEKVPVWVADYVLGGYGTGAVMAVPAHDERDYAFAEKYKLPVIQVIAAHTVADGPYTPREDFDTHKRPVIDAIITDGNDNYLVAYENTEGVPQVYFVGGGIEDEDESSEAAVRREVIEESGYSAILTIRRATPDLSRVSHRIGRDRNQHTWGAAYEVVVDPSVRVASEADGSGFHAVKWVPKEEVRSLLTWPDNIKAWDDYLEGRHVDVTVREGSIVNSGEFDGLMSSEAREKIVASLEEKGAGQSKTTYKMRDWLISRQRYWGAPIPIIHCEIHGAVAVPEDQLPVILPEVEDFAPKGDGQSTLARATDWVNTTCPECGGPAKRETDTMDGYACSSWYLLRYSDPANTERAWDPEKINYWNPVDFYVGGDHAVAHLLYVRFWSHVFYDMGLTSFKEPVKKLVYHGYINAEDGTKMSKSKGNVIDPLDVVNQGYGADALRTYLLFMGPIELDASWDSRGIAGIYRFLNRIWTLVQQYDATENKNVTKNDAAVRVAQHKAIRKVTDDFRRMSFNTAIAALMEYVNELYKFKIDGYSEDVWREALTTLVQLVAPFTPHLADELWQQLGGTELVQQAAWPQWDEALIVEDIITIAVQVNGKLRGEIKVGKDADPEEIKKMALAHENVAKFVIGEPKKVIYVPGRLVSVVA